MDLGKHVLDKELIDRNGLRAGKVDDLLLELPASTGDAPLPEPEVVAIVTGPLALSRNLPRPFPWLARRLYQLLGVARPEPVEVPWSRVTHIDVIVHADLVREEAGLTALADAVARRVIDHLPGA